MGHCIGKVGNLLFCFGCICFNSTQRGHASRAALLHHTSALSHRERHGAWWTRRRQHQTRRREHSMKALGTSCASCLRPGTASPAWRTLVAPHRDCAPATACGADRPQLLGSASRFRALERHARSGLARRVPGPSRLTAWAQPQVPELPAKRPVLITLADSPSPLCSKSHRPSSTAAARHASCAAVARPGPALLAGQQWQSRVREW